MKPLACVIENEVYLAQGFKLALEQAGYEVVVALNGREALDLFETINPFILFLDLYLDDIDGFELMAYIEENKDQAPHIVVITADSRAAEEIESRVDFVYVKPVSYQQIKELAERLHPSHKTGPLVSDS